MTKYLKEILVNSLQAGNSLPLHEILWTIDARFYSILNVEELNSVILDVGGYKVVRSSDSIMLEPSSNPIDITLTEKDMEVAMARYLATISGFTKIKRKG